MLSCNEVLARHSEYIDGVMPALDEQRWRAHLEECAMCSRYDRVLRQGLGLLRHQQRIIEPDPEFIQHLRYRIADEHQRMTSRPVSINAAAGISIAAVLALAAWAPVVMTKMNAATAPAIASSPVDATITEIAWHGGDAVHEDPSHEALPSPAVELPPASPDVSMIDRGYTPVIVESPTAPPSYAR